MSDKTVIIDSSPRTVDFYIQEKSALFIGVEKGAWKLAQSGIPMVLALGDFDSLTSPQLKYLKQVTNTIKLPTAKERSDMEEAILLAKSYGFEKIYIVCDIARIDQFLVNIELVKKFNVKLFSNSGMIAKIVPPMGDVLIRKNQYRYISFFPLTPYVEIKTSEVLEYPLPPILKQSDTTHYVSNTIKGPVVNLKVTSGELLVVQASDPEFVTRRISDKV